VASRTAGTRVDRSEHARLSSERLRARFAEYGFTGLDQLRCRERARVGGEVRIMRIQPRSGVPAVEAVISDGSGELTVIFSGRRIIPGIEHGRCLAVEGVAYRDGDLYVAEIQRVLRFDDIGAHLDAPPRPVVVTDQLPADRHHGWKYLGFGPDGRLYVPVGAPCNVCLKDAPYASILRMNADGSQLSTYARGIRNSVGFDWHPVTGELWFTDNGRDMLGDDTPACELNRATGPGQHFGFPHVHGANTPDPEFGKMPPPAPLVPPVVELGPHVAPLGMLFYTGTQFPAAYRNSMLIAEHGSWNHSRKIGYRVTKVTLDDAGAVIAHEPFASGWLQGELVSGRPVDLEQLADGSVLLSDDEAGVIYRISYSADDD